jgi:ABC-2 type transport system ATP-binding protein
MIPVLTDWTAAPSSDAPIFIEDLVKTYGPQRGVDGICLNVPSGSIYGLLGPNGSGKTTTIRVLLDLVRPDRGKIRILGQDPQTGGARLRQQLGYLPGELGLPDTMNARDTLKLYGDLSGGKTPLRVWIQEVLQIPDSVLGSRLRFFSKGMKQKIGLIQAIQHGPQLLILDEPTTGLDPVIQARLFAGLQSLRSLGVTILLSSHILSEVQALCDRVAVLREGRLILEGAVGEVLHLGQRRLSLRRRGLTDQTPPCLTSASLYPARDQQEDPHWWRYRVPEGATAAMMEELTALKPEDFLVEPLAEESFLELYGVQSSPPFPASKSQ